MNKDFHDLMRTIYGVIAAIGFFEIKDFYIDFDDIINWEIIYNLLLYLFTFSIMVHDWREYHRKIFKTSTLPIVAQLGSLLSIGFMFQNAKYEGSLLWLASAFLLTVFNIINYRTSKEEAKGYESKHPYLMCLVASIANITFYILIYKNDFEESALWLPIILIGIVSTSWAFKFRNEKSKSAEVDPYVTIEGKLNEIDKKLKSIDEKSKTKFEEISAAVKLLKSLIPQNQNLSSIKNSNLKRNKKGK